MKVPTVSVLCGMFLAAGLTSTSFAAERVVFMTDWKPEAEQGGFYEAQALGLYAKHGLDVQIRSGGSGANPQQLMAAGAVDMAIGSNSFFVLNLVKAGAQVTVVRVHAPLELVRERLLVREAAEPAWYLEAAEFLVDFYAGAGLEDHVVENACRHPDEVADDVVQALGWLPCRAIMSPRARTVPSVRAG